MPTPFNTSFSHLTDSYKVSHAIQYPPGTSKIYSYAESRGGKFPVTILFGLQYILRSYFEGIVITHNDLQRDDVFFKEHFGSPNIYNRQGWCRILEKHGGRLPLRICAIP